VVGRTLVEALEPGGQEVSAAGRVAGLEEHVGYGVSGDGVGWAQRQGALRQSVRLLNVACFYEALGRQCGTGGERQSIAVLPLGMVWYLWTPFISHGPLQAGTAPYVLHRRLSVSHVISSCRAT